MSVVDCFTSSGSAWQRVQRRSNIVPVSRIRPRFGSTTTPQERIQSPLAMSIPPEKVTAVPLLSAWAEHGAPPFLRRYRRMVVGADRDGKLRDRTGVAVETATDQT